MRLFYRKLDLLREESTQQGGKSCRQLTLAGDQSSLQVNLRAWKEKVLRIVFDTLGSKQKRVIRKVLLMLRRKHGNRPRLCER
jgi:hypothetical protein